MIKDSKSQRTLVCYAFKLIYNFGKEKSKCINKLLLLLRLAVSFYF